LSLIHSWLSFSDRSQPPGSTQSIAIHFGSPDNIILTWHENGRYYRTDTGTRWRIDIDTAALQPCRFAYESLYGTGLPDEYAVFDSAPAPLYWRISRSVGYERWGLSVLRAFGENPDTAVTFAMGETRVFSDLTESYRMELHADGALRYERLRTAPVEYRTATPALLSDLAMKIISAGFDFWGDARVMLTGFESLDGGYIQLRYDYLLSGLRLYGSDGEPLTAGIFRFQNGFLVSASLILRHLTEGSPFPLEPEHVALWLHAARYPDGGLCIGQFISEDGWVKPSWYVTGGTG
jgi:hypothetical protein